MLVDDERLIRTALGRLLIGGGHELVGDTANAQQAIELVLGLRPDVVLIDLRLPGISGARTIERLDAVALLVSCG